MVYMAVVIDHVFICTSVGAPAAGKLIQFGLEEGAPNRHPGQGTACRRFFFHNFMIELLWVQDPAEAQSEQTRRTRLWDRWSGHAQDISPFGIILRPAAPPQSAIPFPSWLYQPQSMPDLILHIASSTQLTEPMWCYAEAGRRPDVAPPESRQPLEHRAGLRELTGLRLCSPSVDRTAITSAMARASIISWQAGADHLLELEFDQNKNGNRTTFGPDLPLLFRW
jgi:hypothetical protein